MFENYWSHLAHIGHVYNPLDDPLMQNFTTYHEEVRNQSFRLRAMENEEDVEMKDKTIEDIYLKYNN